MSGAAATGVSVARVGMNRRSASRTVIRSAASAVIAAFSAWIAARHVLRAGAKWYQSESGSAVASSEQIGVSSPARAT